MCSRVDTLNEIYEKSGFDGALIYISNELELGDVTITDNGLVRITTCGWSQDEQLICGDVLNFLSVFGDKHYVGFLRGGAYFFCEDIDNFRFDVIRIYREGLE